MDSLITAAAHALAAGDPLGALKRVALRDDAPALALRGIAMAQLGDLDRAKALLRRAARRFSPREIVARARCVVAEAEIALASRDLGWAEKRLEAARDILEAHGDRANAAHARYLSVRRLLLIGQLSDAERLLATLDPGTMTLPLRTVHELVVAGIALRRLQANAARAALTRASEAAGQARIPALTAEVESAWRLLDAPAARLISAGEERVLRLSDVETVLSSSALVIDGCRHVVRRGRTVVSLATRPVLFALARTLGEASPESVDRETLVARAFGSRFVDESHRARLRVEIGRLRAALRGMADLHATKRGFALTPRSAGEVVVLAPPIDGDQASLVALLSDGAAWSTSALALALGASQRTVQRALVELQDVGRVRSIGQARARRWLSPPLTGFTTILLLPATLPFE